MDPLEASKRIVQFNLALNELLLLIDLETNFTPLPATYTEPLHEETEGLDVCTT